MLITVFGATGNTGKEVCRSLAETGKVRIRAVTRDASRAKELPAQEVSEVDWTDRGQLRSAVEGADAAYFMLPTGLYNGSLFEFRDACSRAFIETANELALRRVLFLSSFGAHLPEKSGVLKGLCRAEKNFEAYKGNLTVIRPGYFWQNFLGNIAGIKENGFFGGYPVDPNVKLLFSDTADIGSTVARFLTTNGASGHQTVYVGHPELATFRDVSRLIEEKSRRKDLTWTNVGYESARSFMLGRGMPKEIVDNLIEFFEAINSGRAMDDYTPEKLVATKTGPSEFTTWFAGQVTS